MLNALKSRAQMLPLYPSARSVYRRMRGVPRHPLQDLRVKSRYKLKRLGTAYGGWTFVDHPGLYGSTVFSAGLGEDASFDIEFAKFYGAKVVMIDPTPRAKIHFEEIVGNIGKVNLCKYSAGGKQPVSAYDLTGVDRSQLILVPQALWESAELLKFYEPTNVAHVSHSIVNFQRGYSDEGEFIEVEAITFNDLLRKYGAFGNDVLQLVKLDIEGAEVEVISNFLDDGVRPKQILVEFDELNAPSEKAFSRIDFVSGKLTDNGYQCIWSDKQANFLYVVEEFQPSS